MSPKTSKGSSSSIATLIDQWANQQDHHHSRYRILLQYTTGLATRLQAANSVMYKKKGSTLNRQIHEDTLYSQAGLRTPAESAFRDLFGGVAWVQFLLEIGVENNLQVIWVRTLSRPSFIPTELLSRLKVIDASRDPWGWDDDHDNDDDEEENKSTSLQNLRGLYEFIRSVVMATDGRPTMLVWESLVPLFMVHGFDRVLRFLDALEKQLSCNATTIRLLQVWPVRTETLTADEHSQLSNALMYLKRGEMILMRQGIRESGNLVRELLPFQLIPQQGDLKEGHQLSFRLEPGGGEDGMERDTSTTPSHEKLSIESELPTTEKSKGQQSKLGRSRITLQIESEDRPTSRPSKEESVLTEHRPLIYMQDNDPEFDDMDDEDPDDDLDI